MRLHLDETTTDGVWAPVPAPTVGRIVHYVAEDAVAGEPAHQAAMVTRVGVREGTVALAVVTPTRLLFLMAVAYAAEPTPGTWHWPERDGGPR
jgi:hypothetical protein